MFKFFDKIVDKIEDSALGYVEKYLDSDMQPALRDMVEEQVREFRATIVEQVPERTGKYLKDKDDSTITGMIAEALSGRVETLLEHMLDYYRPEVDKCTVSLTDTITDESMVKVKEFLNLNQQQQANPEPGTRDFQLPGVGKVDITESIGNFFRVEQRMPQLDRSLRENFQPIGELLKSSLWEKFIQVLNLVLNEACPWLNLPVSRDLTATQQKSRGWFGDRVEDIEEVLKKKVVDRVPELYDALKDPVDEIIARMVQWLEDHSVTAAMDLLTSLVKKLDLVRQ